MQLSFSQDDKYLVSASRDRQLGVFKQNDEGLYEIFWIGQVHSRLVFCVEITYDCKYIITGYDFYNNPLGPEINLSKYIF